MSQNLQTTPDPVTSAPSTADEVAATLGDASERRQSVVIRGAGTKLDWGRPAGHIDLILDMRRLNRVLAHQHGDLTATIEAGASLRDVNHALAAHGQWLPLDPPFAGQATIGGILATNDSGPLRHRHGAPRDLVIGIQLATTDGVLSKAGGQVVKNVAGYDLSKLVTGSFGSLAAIVSATFKLAPLASASKTMRVAAADPVALGQMVHAVMASQLEPVAFDIHVRSTQSSQSTQSNMLSANSAASAFNVFSVLLQFASLPQVVDAQIEQARALLTAGPPDCATSIDVLDGPAEQTTWRDHSQRLWDAPGAILRASWLPASLASGLGELERVTAGLKACTTSLIGRAAVGAGLMRIDGDTAAQASVIEQLRASHVFGNIVIVRASGALKALVDVWGPQGDRAHLLASLKQAFDPNGILNAGRGPL
jgi:glycolate oxidase FAD binding subunit